MFDPEKLNFFTQFLPSKSQNDTNTGDNNRQDRRTEERKFLISGFLLLSYQQQCERNAD